MVKKFNIDLSKISGYIEEEHDKKIKGQLIKHGFFNRNCLYSVFNSNRIKQIEETGNYRKESDSIFALTKEELIWESEFGHNSLKELSNQYPKNPAIAIYNRKQFYEDYEKGSRYEYFFINPDKKLEALIAIAFLKFE